MNVFKRIYKDLKRKYGSPKGQWQLWCKRPKTNREREEVILGAILTQRTNWRNVELAINNLKKAKINSLKEVYRLGRRNIEKLALLIRPSGFYQAKADCLFRLSEFILKKYGSLEKIGRTGLPQLREELLALRGIGPETCDSILLYTLDKPIFVIDEYTRRLVKKRRLSGNLSYGFLQKLFEKNLKKDFRLYQDFHGLIVIDGKNKDSFRDVLLPAEYEKGYVKFLNCKIDLSKRPFIPRIETEFWVKKAIKELKLSDIGYPSILDMFAGSGCIGIAVLKDIKDSRVDFVDVDDRAIEQIKITLKLNKIPKNRYRILKSDIFESLGNRRYDYIFANPPYVSKERIKEVAPEVLKYEPKKAILAGKRGMIYIRRFLKGAKTFLKRYGIIYLEIDPQQKEEIGEILEKENYKNFKFFKDQFQKYRWLKIIK